MKNWTKPDDVIWYELVGTTIEYRTSPNSIALEGRVILEYPQVVIVSEKDCYLPSEVYDFTMVGG